MGRVVAPDGGEVEDERPRTRTVEREEINVETVEEEELLCPVCEQWYDGEEIVIVGFGLEEDDNPVSGYGYEEKDHVCRSCAQSLFGYEGSGGLVDAIQYEVKGWSWREILSSAISLGIVAGAAAFLLHGFAAVIDAFGSIGPDAAEAATGSAASGTLTVAAEFVAALVILIMLISIASSVGSQTM